MVGGSRLRPFGNPLAYFGTTNVDPEILTQNVRINMRRGLPLLWPVESLSDKPLLVIGGGPSLKDSVETIRAMQNSGAMLLGLNKAYHYLREFGIVCDYFLMADARIENMPLAEGIHPGTHILLASQIHPSVMDEFCRYELVTMFHLYTDSTREATKEDPEPKPYMLATVGVAGYYGIYAGATLGFRDITCFGYDFSYEGGDHHAFEQRLNDDLNIIDVNFGGETYYTTGIMAFAAERFPQMCQHLYGAMGVEVSVVGRGLLPDIIAAANERGKTNVEDRERKKYQDIWATRQYGEDSSPGMDHVQLAMLKMDWEEGDTVIDFGCGKGEAVKILESMGFKASGLDIAPNAVDYDIDFIEACLWQIPAVLECDWGYCCDVMEHMPTEKVDAVLASIAATVKKGIYFNIATFDDTSGAMIGLRLHLTVMKSDAWEVVLKRHFREVEVLDSEFSSVFVCKK